MLLSLLTEMKYTFDDLKKVPLQQLRMMLQNDDGTNTAILNRMIRSREEWKAKQHLDPEKRMLYTERMRRADKAGFTGDWDDLPGAEDYRGWRKHH